jgi:hypothetical protein
VQSDPASPHELKAWQSGGVHVLPLATGSKGCISDGWSSVCLIFPIILAVLLLNRNAGAHKRLMLATLVIADAGFGPHYGNDP